MAALSITWILDGLEVTSVGVIASVLTEPVSGLNLSTSQIGLAGSIYIVGAITGALFFYLTDKFGRKKLVLITLAVYLIARVATAFSFRFWFFAIRRFFAGARVPAAHSGTLDTRALRLRGLALIVAAELAGWYDDPQTPQHLFPFAAGMWAYKARDAIATVTAWASAGVSLDLGPRTSSPTISSRSTLLAALRM